MTQTQSYSFNWNEIPGNDNGKFIEILKQNIGVEWIGPEEFNKSNDGTIINVSSEKNILSLILNNERNRATLTLNNVQTDELIVMAENDKLSVYPVSALCQKLIDEHFELLRENFKNEKKFWESILDFIKKMKFLIGTQLGKRLGIETSVEELNELVSRVAKLREQRDDYVARGIEPDVMKIDNTIAKNYSLFITEVEKIKQKKAQLNEQPTSPSTESLWSDSFLTIYFNVISKQGALADNIELLDIFFNFDNKNMVKMFRTRPMNTIDSILENLKKLDDGNPNLKPRISNLVNFFTELQTAYQTAHKQKQEEFRQTLRKIKENNERINKELFNIYNEALKTL